MGKQIATLVLLIFGSVISYSAMSGPLEDTVKYRQGILFGVSWNVGSMGAMVKGEAAFDSERFAFLAERTAVLVPMVLEGFKVETKEIESNAKENIWSNFNDFEERMLNLGKESGELLRIAKNGDETEIKIQFGAMAKQCKGCHDEYKQSN